MKTKLLSLLTALLLAQAVTAQFNVGIKGGANVTKIDGKSFKDEFLYGYHVGGFAEIGLGKKWGLQPEVLFNQYQTRVDSTFKNVYQNALNFSENRDIKLSYLSIPVLLNYKVGNVLTLQAGPQVGILIDQNKNLIQNGREAFSKGDFSMLGGAVISISKFRLGGRYMVGLNNINDLDNQNQWKNEGFQVSVGISL